MSIPRRQVGVLEPYYLEYSVEIVELYGVEYPWEFDVFVRSFRGCRERRGKGPSELPFVCSSWR